MNIILFVILSGRPIPLQICQRRAQINQPLKAKRYVEMPANVGTAAGHKIIIVFMRIIVSA